MLSMTFDDYDFQVHDAVIPGATGEANEAKVLAIRDRETGVRLNLPFNSDARKALIEQMGGSNDVPSGIILAGADQVPQS